MNEVRESIKELSVAMAKAFAQIEGASADKTNPHFKSKYADLGNVIDAIKPAISEHGLWFYQVVHSLPGFAAVETVIVHSSGERLSCGVVNVPVVKNDAQGYGSALTYARRYSLSSAFGVAPEDDDGNKACEQPKKFKKQEEKQQDDGDDFPKLAQESQLAKDLLTNRLIEVTGILEPEFMECITRKEACCKEAGVSFCGELTRWINDPKGTIENYNKWKAKESLKKPVDRRVVLSTEVA